MSYIIFSQWSLKMTVNYELKKQKAIKRFKDRNPQIYTDTAVEGVDYIVCPVTNARMIMMKSTHITKTLGMTVEEFDALYPNFVKGSTSRIMNLTNAANKVDPITGLTVAQTTKIKAELTLSTPDENGVTGYQKLGQKTKATHLSKVDENGRNGYQRQAHGRVTTVLENGLTVEENAHIKRQETLNTTMVNGCGRASKVSKKWLKPIVDYLNDNEIPYYFDTHEFGINDSVSKNRYSFDLTIKKYNIAIEYQSNAYHSNPAWDDEKWNTWKPCFSEKSAEEVLAYDYNKARALYRMHQVPTYYVWEDTAKEDAEGILCLLKTVHTKYLLQLAGEISTE